MSGKTMNVAGSAGASRRMKVVMVGMAMTLLAAVSVSARAQPAPGGMERGGMERGGMERGGMERGGWNMHHGPRGGGGGMGGMFGPPEHTGRMIDHLLDGLNATDAQRTQIKQIAAAAFTDLRAQRQAGRGLRQQGMDILTAPTVDPAAAERLRQQTLQQHDQTSRRMTQALLDVARVLTPEQRARLAERMKDRRARMEERMKRMEREPRR